MASHIVYERFIWFDGRIRAGKHPNANQLAEHFEISPKTAQRTIEFMRYRLRAPLRYLPQERGYIYENDTWELPGLWLNEEELTSLLVSYRLASAIPDSTLKTSFKSFLDQIITRFSPAAMPVSVADLNKKVSVKNIEYSRTNEKTFHTVLDALVHGRSVTIEYYSPHNHEATTRDILPLHLLQYMGTWHIIAHCNLKDGLRDFVLSRIKTITPSQKTIAAPTTAGTIKDYLRKHFGIMTSPHTIEVCLRFSPEIAPWIAEQVWHPAQQIRHEKANTLCLTFPVADLREIKREILKYGAQVEVVSPKALREEVKKEIEKMKKKY